MPSGQLPRTLQPPPELPDIGPGQSTLANYLRTFSLWCRHGFADKISGSTAAPGLMLQAYNAVAGQLPATWLLQVGQGGGLWVTPIAAGSGVLGTPARAVPLGIADGSDAPAGHVGEYVIASPAAINLTNNVAANVVTMPLTAGDWDVEGLVQFTFATPYAQAIVTGVSTVSATFPTPQPGRTQYNATAANINVWGQPTGMCRVSIAATTPVYLVALALMGGTGTAQGVLRARRSGNVG